MLYGITYPDAHFFSFDINTRRSRDYGPMLDTLVFSGPERSWRSVPRALLVLEDGRVLTSGIEGYLIFLIRKPANLNIQTTAYPANTGNRGTISGIR
jgi:hypothetical protein